MVGGLLQCFFASMHKVYDKEYIGFFLSIIHSVASGFGIKFVHHNYMRDLFQVYEVDSVNCTFKI